MFEHVGSTPLDYDDYVNIFTELLSCDDDMTIKKCLVDLNTKQGSEVTKLLRAAVTVLQQHMRSVNHTGEAIDVVGTGGDGLNTLNFSTATAIALAANDIDVIKHGNRRVSSQCGSADVLQTLGITELPHFQFLLAPEYHPILKKFKSLREQLAVPTVFNLLGPLLNPAKPSHAIIGVKDAALVPIFADVCAQMHFQRVMIVHTDGMDELSCHGQPTCIELIDGQQKPLLIDLSQLGLQACTIDDLRGSDAAYNASVLTAIFSGQPHPAADTLCLNIGAGLYLMGVANDLAEGVANAKTLLASGRVADFIQQSQGAE